MGDSGSLDFLITHPSDGAYVYTASISSWDTIDTETGNNSFTVYTTVDTITQSPTLVAPLDSSYHINTEEMDISFSIPEATLTNSIQLHFIPTDLSGGTISLTLADVVPTIQQDVSLSPEDIMTLPWVVSTNGADSIPNGTYTVMLSYQDVFGNPAATSSVTNIIIIDEPTPYILTEIIPIPSTISTLTGTYVFSAAGTGIAEVFITHC